MSNNNKEMTDYLEKQLKGCMIESIEIDKLPPEFGGNFKAGDSTIRKPPIKRKRITIDIIENE